MSFSMKIQEKGKSTIIKFQGEIDLYDSLDFKDSLLLDCNGNTKEVIVDLSQVSSIDFSGVATLIEGLKWCKKNGKLFVLKNVSTNVMSVLSEFKLKTTFKIISSPLSN
jgi:anti-sigma B factor antagonist